MLTLLAPSRLHYEGHTTHAIQFPVGGPGHIQSPGIPLAATEDADLLFTPSLSLRLATKTAYAETRLPPTRSDRQLGSLSHTHSLPPAPTNPFSRVELECAEPVSPVLVGSEPGQLSTFCSSHRQPEALLQAFVSRHRLPYCCAGTLSHRSRLPFPALPCPALPSPSSSPYITYLHARTRSRRLDSLSTVQCIGLGWRKTRAIPTEFHRRQQREWGVSSPPLHPSSPARRISSHCTATDPIVWYLSDLH